MSTLELRKYTKGEKIGFGSFGEVFKIIDNATSKIYAAKISTIAYDDSKDDFPKDLKREISIVSKIRHPAILKLIGVSLSNFTNEKKPVIITDYYPNGSLDKLLEDVHHGKIKSEWNDTIKLIISYGIAAAMSFLHDHNIIHRDLKPANILLNEYLFPILADFGLSKDERLENSSKNLKGTPLYIAPELFAEGEYSKKSDVYAYSLILYEIYANRKPFDNFNIRCLFKLFEGICKGKRPDISSVPKPFNNLIKKCWSSDPSERPNFEEIIEQYETNKNFITSTVEKDDFFEYVNYIKKSPKSFNEKVKIDSFSSRKTKIIKKIKLSKIMIYPKEEYVKLTKSCKNLIDRAKEDTNEQYKIGSYLIEGKKGFPKNVEIGVKYLKQAIKGGSIEAVIMYNRMLIIGKRIEANIKEAKNNLSKYESENNPNIIFLQAMIEKKEKNYPKALNLLKKSIKAGIGEAMFEYGKMLYLGEGCDENVEKAMSFFQKAKKNGCDKSDKFLEKQDTESKLKRSSYSKKIDLVFLIDGQITNKYFYEALDSSIIGIAQKCINENPKIGFRFGVVIYRNLIVSQKTIGTIKKWPFIYDLTREIDDVKSFLEENHSYERGVKFANDWASGYHALVDQITWDESAEKVVIQIADSPGYGGRYLMRNDLKSKYLIVPSFAKGNKPSENRRIMNEILEKQDGWLYYNIIQLAQKGVKFYCLNGNEVALYCFNQVSKAFFKNGGDKFVIKDLFGFIFNVDDDDDDDDKNVKTLKKEIIKFTLNVVKCCLEGDEEFEENCKDQFSNDLDKFFRKNLDSDDDDDGKSSDDDDDEEKDDDDDDGKSSDDDDDKEKDDDDDDEEKDDDDDDKAKGSGDDDDEKGGSDDDSDGYSKRIRSIKIKVPRIRSKNKI